jgi:hypothetical protein
LNAHEKAAAEALDLQPIRAATQAAAAALVAEGMPQEIAIAVITQHIKLIGPPNSNVRKAINDLIKATDATYFAYKMMTDN